MADHISRGHAHRHRTPSTRSTHRDSMAKLKQHIEKAERRSRRQFKRLRRRLQTVLNDHSHSNRPTQPFIPHHSEPPRAGDTDVTGRVCVDLSTPLDPAGNALGAGVFSHQRSMEETHMPVMTIVKPYRIPITISPPNSSSPNQIIKPYAGLKLPRPSIEPSPLRELSSTTLLPIEDQPYCTHNCLFGLAHGWREDVNLSCPNARLHGATHMTREAFLFRLKDQLESEDQEQPSSSRSQNRMVIKKVGREGRLCKIRLESHGYTLVAKSLPKESSSAKYCVWEAYVYDEWLQSIHWKHIPVSPGVLNLRSDDEEFTELLMSYGGLSASELGLSRPTIGNELHQIFKELHKLKVKQNEVRLSNILFDDEDRMMIVDFFSSMIYDHEETMSEETRMQFARERSAVSKLIDNQHRSSRKGSPIL